MIALIVSMLLSFATSIVFTPHLIRFLEAAGIVGIDMHKRGRLEIAEMGGPAVLVGFLSGIFFYIFINKFLYNTLSYEVGVFAAIATALIISIVGMFDDLGSLARRVGGKRVGLRRLHKFILPLAAAIPLMSIMAGSSVVNIPFIGGVNLGLLYPLLVVPLIVSGMSNAFNMVAGMNGLEAGMGIVYLTGLGVFTFMLGKEAVAAIAFCAAFALLGFLRYNWYPARIMAGDSLVYFVGAVAASVVVLGNIEKFALIAFLPWIIELVLKMRSGLSAENFGLLQKDGTLKSPYKKIYSLTSLFMHIGRFKEHQIVTLIIALGALSMLAAFLVSFNAIVI